MAGVTNREFWDFRVKTRAQFTKLAEQIANIDTSGGGGISELTSKMVVDALGYTPYNATNPANYITSDALSPYAKTADVSITYATIASVQGFENRIGGLESAVPQLNERVTTVEVKVSSLNETVSTGKNNLLDRVNTIETDYVTSGNLESAINGIDLSVYLLKADLTKSRIQSTLGISDWALATSKPAYTASEVGAMSVYGGTVNGETVLQHSNSFILTIKRTGSGASLIRYNGDEGIRGGIGFGTDGVARIWDNTLSGNYPILTSDNFSQYALPITGGTVNGSITATSFIGNLTGNAGSATKLETPRTLWGQSFDGTGKVSGAITLPNNTPINVTNSAGTSANNALLMTTSNNLYLGYGTAVYYGSDTYIWGKNIKFTNKSGQVIGSFSNDKLGIGVENPSEKFEVSGNIKTNAITIGGVTLSWDSVNNALVVNGNMYATGSITAKKSV